MSQMFTAASAVSLPDGGWRWRRFVALVTAAVLMLLGLLTSAAPTASADTPTASADTPAGLVTGWGKREHLDLPFSLRSTGATAITANMNHGLALTPDGKVVAWGESGVGLPDVPASLADETVTAIAAGGYHDLALTSDGKVTAWGDDKYGQTDVPATLNGATVTAIAAGGEHSLALTSDGKVTAWGLDVSGQTDVPASLDGATVTAVSAGQEHSLALTSDGKVTAWGESQYGRTDVPASLDGRTVTAIAAGGLHSLALTSDGKVTAWGYDGSGGTTAVPASLDGKTVTAIAAGLLHSLALTSDGKVTAWGSDSLGQTDVPASLDGSTVTAIAAGLLHSLALTSDGKVTAWGSDSLGQTDVPASLDGSTVTAIAAGSFTSVALTRGLPPVVTRSPPADARIEVGTQRTFTVAASGSPAPTVQWQRSDGGDFKDLPGATSTTYTFTPVAADDRTSLRAVFTNPYGSDTSFDAYLMLNDLPSAPDMEVTAGFGSATPVTLSSTDDEGDVLTFSVIAQPEHGTLSGDAPALTYTPDSGYSGADSFTYRVDDYIETFATGTVSITVTKPNAAPTAKDLEVKAGFEAATPVTLSGTDNDGDHLTYAVEARPEHGTLSGDVPALTYTPDDGYSGGDTFTYRVNDGTKDSATATVGLTVNPESCLPSRPERDFSVEADEHDADGAVRTPKFSTSRSGELLLAYVAADGSTRHPQSVTRITGGGLTWTLVRRENTVRGTSEIWQAYAATKIRSTRVDVDLAAKGHSVTLMVAGFNHARPTVGSSANASGTSSTPQVSLTPQASGSVVWAVGRVVGSRYDAKPVSGQKVVHDTTFRSPRAGYWTQRTTAASKARTDVRVHDSDEATRWGYAAVEIRGTCR
jgi:alpha-tubulin suppressor-like RCC1 family protein